MRAGAGAGRGRSLRGQQPAWRPGARAGRRGREQVAWVGAARARRGRIMAQAGLAGGAAAVESAARGAGEGRWGSRVAQAGGAERRRSVERAGVSGWRQMEMREGAAGGASEHEQGSRGNVSTLLAMLLFRPHFGISRPTPLVPYPEPKDIDSASIVVQTGGFVLTLCPSPSVLADARPSALLALAPSPIVLALPRLPPSCSLPPPAAPSLVSVWRRPLTPALSTLLLRSAPPA